MTAMLDTKPDTANNDAGAVAETSPQRQLYRHADLKRMLDPQSIAIVGASSRKGSFGERLRANLGEYEGRVYLINARYDDIGGEQCYPSVSALPEVPDCVVLAVPNEAVMAVVEECAGLGVGGVVIFASGFAETGHPEQVAAQQRLGEIARESGMRIIGPNCLGFANYQRKARVTFSEYPVSRPLTTTSVGIASQSGALSQSLAQAIERGVSVSHTISTGNSSDVDVADLVAFLAEDPGCKAIACVFEGMANPRRLIEAAEIAKSVGKPLLIHKIATGEIGAAAAMSHTGSLAGSDAAYRAAFRRAGVIVIDDFEALIEAACFFAKAPPPKAEGVAVVATSGGAAIMAADKAEIHGVPLPQPSPSVRAILEAHIPDFGSANNPCDVTAQVVNNPESLWACGEALMSDSAFGAVVVPQPVAFAPHTPRIGAFSELSQKHGKITCNVTISEWLQGPATQEAEENAHVAQFRSMTRCFATLAQWQQRDARLRRGARKLERLTATSVADEAAELIRRAGNTVLAESESKQVLDLYGIPVVREILAQSGDEAVAAAQKVGYPVVLKVESVDLPHKTEAGVIRLNLGNETEVRKAYDEVMANANKVEPQPRINGVLVQPMIGAGVEIMVGARMDPLFGPLIVVGMGGVLVELLKDTAVELAPVTRDEARDMIDGLKGSRLLQGFRGSKPVDMEVLVDVVCRLSEMVSDQRELVAELDINPLICSENRIIAVDALIVRT